MVQGSDLGKEYVQRLQRLQTKQKFKKAVNGIVWSIRLRKAAVEQALKRAKEDQEASMEVENPIVASVVNTTEEDTNVEQGSRSHGHHVSNSLGSLQGIADAKDERLVVSLDQIQRLASGLSRNASYKLGRTDSGRVDSPAPTSDETKSQTLSEWLDGYPAENFKSPSGD